MTAVAELWSYRNLVYHLAQRELRSRYKKSILGWAWSLINPASTLLIFTVVFGTFLRVIPPVAGNGTTQSFALFLFSGLIVWNTFNGILTGSISALASSGGLLSKVYFPPAVPALANAATVLIQTVIETFILLVVMVVVGNLSITLLLFPLVIVVTVMLGLGAGLMLSVYNVLYRDVGYLVGIGMNVLFYATPIVYPITLVPEEVGGLPARRLIELNPMTQVVGWMRDGFYLLEWPSPRGVAVTGLVALVVLVGGWALFDRKARLVTEEL